MESQEVRRKKIVEEKPRQIGFLAREFGGVNHPLTIIKSAAGYYIGTLDEDGAPYSRESEEYWRGREEAEEVLRTSPSAWTQRPAP
jgi:hypothetical protein